ncbi:MAG: hypothetical protein A3J38_05130 [Gammaproteobacteria bacterium RIFCSPHIGHO2_12_FULL_45_9]|nr:MAG: hypothetical protein A3J38_05130 [Gammaproteobacteria bacterium RIFCSPHIGHO2_12_FULL_45_9]
MTHLTHLNYFTALLGQPYVLTGADMAPFLTDWRGRYQGQALCVLRPDTVATVSAIVTYCAQHQIPMVPQGGNTSTCGGSVPDNTGQAVVIQLGRLNRIRQLDAENDTLTLEAGCTLQQAQLAAHSIHRLFPLSIASEGSCQIGGNLATNAGGVHVLRYGMMRQLTLGLEVVLPDGTCWNGLRGLRKDNTGYDLKHLFIGSEGTLGIITAATLALFPQPTQQQTAWIPVPSLEAALSLFHALRAQYDTALIAFEVVSEAGLALVLRHIPHTTRPTPQHPWYVLCELATNEPALLDTLPDWLAQHAHPDTIFAQTPTHRTALWHLRESLAPAQKCEGISIKHDIALPRSTILAFLADAAQWLAQHVPEARPIIFGHLGDGNLHYNVFVDTETLHTQETAIQQAIYDCVYKQGGSIAAEHGIGQLKRDNLPHYKSAVEMALMQKIKQALDPHHVMNPGKLLSEKPEGA